MLQSQLYSLFSYLDVCKGQLLRRRRAWRFAMTSTAILHADSLPRTRLHSRTTMTCPAKALGVCKLWQDVRYWVTLCSWMDWSAG